LRLLHAIRPHLMPVHRLRLARAHLLMRGHPLCVRMACPHLLASSHSSLGMAHAHRLALRVHLHVGRTLRPFHPREALLMRHSGRGEGPLHARRSLALHPRRREPAAAVASATAAAVHKCRPAASAAATATAMLPVRARCCRGCDRQRGNARGEKHPGHDNRLLSNG
jgi:hypothetical protein